MTNILLPLLLFEPIMTLIAIMTLLLPLFLFDKIMILMTYSVYCWHYYNGELLFTSLLLSQVQNTYNSNNSNNSNNIFYANSLPKVVKRGRIPGLTG